MKKQAMHFESLEPVPDGMFMKRAQLDLPTGNRPAKPVLTPPKPAQQVVRPGDVQRGAGSPAPMPHPMKTASSLKHLGIPLGVRKEAANLKDSASQAAGAAKGVANRLGQTGSILLKGTGKALSDVPAKAEQALRYVEGLTPEAQAALVGGTGYVGAKKALGGTKALARGTAKATPSAVQKLLQTARRLRGR